MLVELHVSGLGVIEDARLSFAEGLTALTGETGAGKTLLVDALDLVLGGKPRRGLVRSGTTALVEAVFADRDGTEVILARELPTEGRSRAWIDGRMASVAALEERAAGLCDIYGQHEHQSLLGSGSMRRSLDAFAEIDTVPLRTARAEVREIAAERQALGGEPASIQREVELLDHQIAEIDRAALTDDHELERLLDDARLLEDALSLRADLEAGLDLLEGERTGPRDALAVLAKTVATYPGLHEAHGALLEAGAALEELASALRRASESVEEDPVRLNEVNERLGLLHDLCRRYGPTLSDVIVRRSELRAELDRLRASEERRATLEHRAVVALDLLARHELHVASLRRDAAPVMVTAIRSRLSTLALERAALELTVNGPAGDEVQLLFSANPGLRPQPMAKVASGGELARLMLAIRLTLPGGPATMVFDEVDAGVGGATAVTLAAALRDVAQQRQVLVVTHLAQVAAAADHHIGVTKTPGATSTSAGASHLDGEGRIAEVARMLSGHPDSVTARSHAAELLDR